jgi:hypothetical protein
MLGNYRVSQLGISRVVLSSIELVRFSSYVTPCILVYWYHRFQETENSILRVLEKIFNHIILLR